MNFVDLDQAELDPTGQAPGEAWTGRRICLVGFSKNAPKFSGLSIPASGVPGRSACPGGGSFPPSAASRAGCPPAAGSSVGTRARSIRQ